MLFVVSYLCVAVVYLFKGVDHVNKDVKAALKCFPLLMLIVWFVYQWKYPVNGSWKYSNTETDSDATFILTVVALVSSVTGDAFLVGHFKLGFPLGVVAFAFAQVLYSFIFSRLIFNAGSISLKQICLSALLVLFTDFSVVLLVYSRLKTLLTKIDKHRRLVTYLILIYFGLISMMLWTSLCLFVFFYNIPAFLGLLGGALFYLSDLFITLSAIYRDTFIFKRRVLVMFTYYSSQFFITLCVLSLCTNK